VPSAPWARKLLWAHLMVHLGECVRWKLVSFCLVIGALFTPYVPQAWISFQAHPMVLLGDVGQVEARLVLISRQDMCMVCASCTIGSKIALGIPDGNPK
jgi:hypothetical protein